MKKNPLNFLIMASLLIAFISLNLAIYTAHASVSTKLFFTGVLWAIVGAFSAQIFLD